MSKHVFFITGAGTEIGKTYASCAILRDLKARYYECHVLKPVLSGYEPDEAAGSDAGLLLKALGLMPSDDAIAAIAPWRYHAPLAPHHAARKEGKELPYDDVVAFCRSRAARNEGVLLVEGAGGVMAPLGDQVTNLDLIEAVGAPVVFVAGTYLGAVSHALTGLEVLKARGLAIKAVIVNESAESVGLDSTLSMLAPHCESVPVLTLQRGQDRLVFPV